MPAEPAEDEEPARAEKPPHCWFCNHRCGLDPAGLCQFCQRAPKKETLADEGEVKKDEPEAEPKEKGQPGTPPPVSPTSPAVEEDAAVVPRGSEA